MIQTPVIAVGAKQVLLCLDIRGPARCHVELLRLPAATHSLGCRSTTLYHFSNLDELLRRQTGAQSYCSWRKQRRVQLVIAVFDVLSWKSFALSYIHLRSWKTHQTEKS